MAISERSAASSNGKAVYEVRDGAAQPKLAEQIPLHPAAGQPTHDRGVNRITLHRWLDAGAIRAYCALALLICSPSTADALHWQENSQTNMLQYWWCMQTTVFLT